MKQFKKNYYFDFKFLPKICSICFRRLENNIIIASKINNNVPPFINNSNFKFVLKIKKHNHLAIDKNDYINTNDNFLIIPYFDKIILENNKLKAMLNGSTNKTHNEYILNDYYFLCGLLDDNIDMLASFIKEKKITKHKKSSLIIFFESLRLWNIQEEINLTLDFKLDDFKNFKARYLSEQLRLEAKESGGYYHSTIFDFL